MVGPATEQAATLRKCVGAVVQWLSAAEHACGVQRQDAFSGAFDVPGVASVGYGRCMWVQPHRGHGIQAGALLMRRAACCSVTPRLADSIIAHTLAAGP